MQFENNLSDRRHAGDAAKKVGFASFYIADEKCLTPVYMIIQDSIDKIVKYVKISNDRDNKKTNR